MDLKYVVSIVLLINHIAAQEDEKDAKIMNGTQVPLHIPWVAAIYFKRYDPNNFPPIPPSCGGSIVDQRFILTAAHCVFHKNHVRPASNVQVVVGQSDLRVKEKLVLNVKRIIPYPNFNRWSPKNDLALLEMERPMELRLPFTYSIGISEKWIPEGQWATVAGWGFTCLPPNVDYHKRIKLSYLNVIVHNNIGCSRHPMDNTIICAGSKHGSVQRGDSGSGLWIVENGQPQLIGLESYGPTCTIGNDVYTRLSQYRHWILRNIYQNNNGYYNTDYIFPTH